MTQLRLGDILLHEGLISKADLEAALQIQQEQGHLLSEVLLELGVVREEAVAEAIANQFSLPCLSASQCRLQKDVIKELPLDFLRKNVILPLEKFENFFVVVIGEMLDEATVTRIEQTTGCQLQAFVGTRTDILKALDRFEREIEFE